MRSTAFFKAWMRRTARRPSELRQGEAITATVFVEDTGYWTGDFKEN
jgi:hypothetical protein